MADSDTIIALSSGRLPAALGIVRASGPGALALTEALVGPLPEPRQASLRRFADPGTGAEIDRGLLLVFPGPDSATGEDLVEFHLHGSRAVVAAMLAAATARDGVRLAEAGEFTRRALANGRLDLVEAEGLGELLAAETELQRRAAQSRAGGAVSAELESWRQRLLAIAAAAEIAIDYADEDDGVSAPDVAGPARLLGGDIAARLSAPPIDRLRDGFRVVFAGEPNAGKSSLINSLSKTDRSIVTPIAGTTRDSIEVPVSFAGLPIILIDTAGIRDSSETVERMGIDRAKIEIDDADLVIWLGNENPLIAIPPTRLMMIAAKSDLSCPHDGTMVVSSLTGDGVDALWKAIVDRLSDLAPRPADLALTERERILLLSVHNHLNLATLSTDSVIVSEYLRLARVEFDRLLGRAGMEELLDALFGQFCVGK